MKRFSGWNAGFAGGLVLACGIGIGVALAQPPSDAAASAAKKAMNEAMNSMFAPGEGHRILDALAGSKTGHGEFKGSPGMAGTSFTLDSEAKWVLGGRFIEARSKPAPGEELAVETISYFGFDTRTSKYFWWGIDTMGTYSVFAQGDYDAATKTITMFGENLEPGLGTMKFRTVVIFVDDASYKLRVDFQAPESVRAMVPPGAADAEGWFNVMEMTVKNKS